MLRKLNVVGPIILRLRFQRGWTRKVMAARLQLIHCNITPQIIANIELQRCRVSDTLLIRIAAVFGVYLVDLFPEKWRHCILMKDNVRDCPSHRFCSERRPSKSRRKPRRSKKK